jgi:hypothetical protein
MGYERDKLNMVVYNKNANKLEVFHTHLISKNTT